MGDKLYVIEDRMGNPIERYSTEEAFINQIIKKGAKRYVGLNIKVYSVMDCISVDGYIDKIKRSKNIDNILSDDHNDIEKFINHISNYDVNKEFLDTLTLLRFDAELKKIIKVNKMSLFYYVSNDVEWYDHLLSKYNFHIQAFMKKIMHIKNNNWHTIDPLTGKFKRELDFDLIETNFKIAYEKRNNI